MGSIVSTLRRSNSKYILALFAIAFLYHRFPKNNNNKRRKKKKKENKLEDGKGKKRLKTSVVKSKIWNMLLPKTFTSSGAIEILQLIALYIIRIPVLLDLSDIVKEGDRVLFTRDVAAYWITFRRFLISAVSQTVIQEISTYLKKNLELKWREKVTKKLHENYFDKSNYYHVETIVSDVDARMTEDVEQTTTGYADFLNAALFNGTTGLFYLSKLWYEYGFFYAASPFIYIIVAQFTASKLVPMNFGIFRTLSSAKAKYRNAQTRLVVHSEAIAALNGANREQEILDDLFDSMNSIQRTVYDKLLYFTGCNQFFLRHLLGVVVGWFVIGPGVFTNTSADTMSIQAIANVRAEVGYQFILFIQVMYSAAMGNRMFTAYNKIQGPASRIVELFQALKGVTKRDAAEQDANFKDDNCIAFESVDVFTPTGNLLVKNLTFEVNGNNDSLLLTGHNGAGKSSIFRCLAGLWKIPTGEITKPMSKINSSSLSGDVFYLPQKPYNVVGTLVDQLTYPASANESDELSMEYLKDILGKVELGYLADRKGAFTDDTNWEDALSLGEKQRLAIARLLHHKPKFAILDECTSGVAAGMEKYLYLLLNEMDISYITISHRPILEGMHCKLLCINGDAEKTYTYKILRTPEELKEELNAGLKAEMGVGVGEATASNISTNAAGGGGGGSGSERRKSLLLHQRSQPYSNLLEDRTDRTDTMKRTFESGNSIEAMMKLLDEKGLPRNWKQKVLMVFGGIIGQALMTDVQLFFETEIFRALFQRDQMLFIRTAAFGVLGALGMAAVTSFAENAQNMLEVDLKESLTKKFMSSYMAKAGFYSLKSVDGRITDPEARISDDLNEFVEMLSSLVLEVIKPLTTITWLGYRLSRSVGVGGASSLYAYLFAAGILTRVTMPDFKSLVAKKNKELGTYKYSHSSVRTHCESIAFFGGGDREKAIAWKRFQGVLKVEKEKVWADFWFGNIKSFFVRQMPDRVQQHLRFQFAINNFQDDSKIFADGGAALSMGQHMIWGVQNAVKRSVNDLVEVSDKFNNLSGVIFRLYEMQLAIEELPTPAFRASSKKAKMIAKRNKDNNKVDLMIDTKPLNPTIQIKNLDVVTPTGQCLCSNINVDIDKDNRLLVTGPNASGKTSFFRVMGGLWPVYPSKDGQINIQGDLFLVPQRVYSVTGTLLDQVTYPIKVEEKDVTDTLIEEAQALLDLVGIGYLVGRDGGWNIVRKFEDVLSLGEQQRLGMARLFFHNPSFAVLDECTDAVSVDVEERLYKAAVSKNIVCITISKRLALVDFHETELNLGGDNKDGFVVKKL